MSNSRIFVEYEKLAKLSKDISMKEDEIKKRREVIETTTATSAAKKKEESRVEAIDDKITSKVAALDKTIDYYKGEIDKAQTKADSEIAILEAKFEAAKKKVQDNFERYRVYCMTAIQSEEAKKSLITEPLEKKKEMILQMNQKTEDDDKTLVRLKVELKQLQERHQESQSRMESLMEQDIKDRNRKMEQTAREEMEMLRRIEMESNEKAKVEMELKKQKEQEETEARRERNRLRQEEEMALQKAKEQEKKQQSNLYSNFKTSIYPLLSAEATAIFNYLKQIDNGVDQLYREAYKRTTLDDCEEYLLSFQTECDQLQAFEATQLSKLPMIQQELYDFLGFYDRLKAIKIKDKTKRKEFLEKMNVSSEDSTAEA